MYLNPWSLIPFTLRKTLITAMCLLLTESCECLVSIFFLWCGLEILFFPKMVLDFHLSTLAEK